MFNCSFLSSSAILPTIRSRGSVPRLQLVGPSLPWPPNFSSIFGPVIKCPLLKSCIIYTFQQISVLRCVFLNIPYSIGFLDSYSADTWFEARSRHWLYYLMLPMVFLSPSKQILGLYLDQILSSSSIEPAVCRYTG
jgi:hypothetical protein